MSKVFDVDKTKVIYVNRSQIRQPDATPIVYGYIRDDNKVQAVGDCKELRIDGPCTIVFAPNKEIDIGGVDCWIQVDSSVSIVTDSELIEVR